MNLNQVTVVSIDVKKSIDFYKKIGLNLIVESIPKYARFVCPNGNSTFSIHQTQSIPNQNNAIVYFEVNDVDLEFNRLKNLGIEFEVEPIDQPWLWKECKLHDPDGNTIIIYHTGNNRINPPWRIKI